MNTQSKTLNHRESRRRQPTQRTVAAVSLAGACVLAAAISPAAAQPRAVAAESQTGTAAAGVSLFVGPPTDGFIAGYSGGTVYTNTRPHVIDVNPPLVCDRRAGASHLWRKPLGPHLYSA